MDVIRGTTETDPGERFAGRRAFTLMELMVAVTILVVIILAINMTFKGASDSVGKSQATMDLMANVRGAQQLIERQLRGLDRNGYLVIRSRLNDIAQGDRSLRFDQISFLANGQFQNPTGADTDSPFTDSSTANSARIWIGQLVLEKSGGDLSFMMPTKQPSLRRTASRREPGTQAAGKSRKMNSYWAMWQQ